MTYTSYNLMSGEISGFISCNPNHVTKNLNAGDAEIEGYATTDKMYVDVSSLPHSLIDRQLQICTQDIDTILANNSDVSTFTGVEVGSEMFIDGISEGIEDGDGIVEVAFDTVGTYKIKFVLFPFLDKEFTVNAA